MSELRRSQRLRAAVRYQPSGLQAAPRIKRKATNVTVSHEAVEPAQKKLRLTEKNLNKHQRLHQPSRSRKTMGRPRKTPSSASRTTVTTTDKQFASKLVENGVVYEIFDAEPPDDVDQIKAALQKVQEMPPLVRRDWDKMREAKRQLAQGELSLESMIVESMFYHHDSPFNYLRYRNEQWTEVENEITAGISDAKPDVTEAYTWSAYPPGTRDDFEELVPTQYGYAMPTFAMESKGPSGDPEQAVRQAAYDGAIMTHAALAIDGHVGKSLESQLQKTKAITMTLSPVEINVYANHAVQGTKGKKRFYHQYRVVKVQYLDSEEDWNKAHMVVVNAQELGLALAKSRVQALWKHVEDDKMKLEQMKARNTRLHTQAQAQIAASIGPAGADRLKTKDQTPEPHDELPMEVKPAITPPSSKHTM